MSGLQENRKRLAEQFWQGTVGQIRRAPVVAARWKAWAETPGEGVPSAEEIATRATDGAVAFIDTIDRLGAKAQDAAYTGHLDAAIAYLTDGQFTVAQVRSGMATMRQACVALRDADKSTAQALIDALDALVAAVPVIPDEPGDLTLWD